MSQKNITRSGCGMQKYFFSCEVWAEIMYIYIYICVCVCVCVCVWKVKWSRYRPGVAQRMGRGIALLFHDRGTRRVWVVSSTSRPHFTPGKSRYPFYRRLGGPQGRSGRAENLVPTAIRSRTVQPVAQSLYRLSYRAHIYCWDEFQCLKS